jgi:hypothetical protein
VENSEILFQMLKKIDEKQDIHTESLAKLEVISELNREDLEIHIKRTNLLEDQVKQNRECICRRVEKLEAPGKVFKLVTSILLKLSTVLAAFFGVYTVIKNLF